MKFKDYIELKEYNEYIVAIDYASNPEEYINEELNESIKSKIEFIKSFASILKSNVSDLIDFFKNKILFKIFKAIKFSLGYLFKMLKDGYKAYQELQKVISKYASDTKVVKFTEEQLKKLDDFLMKHPKIKRFSGFAVSGILIYTWLNMSFTGDLFDDFDLSNVLLALQGKFTLTMIFAGPEGTKMLILFATGALLGISFPWPGPSSIKLASAFLYSISKTFKIRIPSNILSKLNKYK